MVEIENLTVRFGGVIPLDGVSLVFASGTCGLIGPNGAGKTTFFNVMSGFVKPSGGTITAFGENLLKMTDYRRSRWGLRRTFQTEMAIEQLSVYDNVAMIHEHSSAKRATRRADVLSAIEFVGLTASPKSKVRTLNVRDRRLVEVARAVVGQPRVVLLDEPAAGLPDQETEHLGERDSTDPGAVRRAHDPRRPRHEPGLGVLRDDRGPRFRKADRGRAHGGGAARRARHQCLPRDRRGAVTEVATGVALRVEGLSISRGARTVVHDVSLEIPQGEVTTLLGANGAGKSTLVLAIGGILRPSDGRVLLGELDLTRRRPEAIRAAGVAVVPEGRRLLPELTVEDNLRVATFTLSRAERRERLREVFDLFPKLQARLKAPGRQLSGGEQQMVVLAQALASRPRIMIVDELSLGLAPIVVKSLVPTLEEVAQSGVGILLIEQFAHVALSLANTAYVLEGGRIRYRGPAEALRDRPDLLHSAYLSVEQVIDDAAGS